MTSRAEQQAADQAREEAIQAKHNAAAIAAMRADEANDAQMFQDWLDGKDVPMPEVARLRRDKAQGINQRPAGPLLGALRRYVPIARVCPQCSSGYVGASRLCPPCSDAAIAQHDRNLAARLSQEARTTVYEARHKWANLPPYTGRSFTMDVRLETSGIPEAIAATQTWIAGNGPPWLLLVGSVGIGKSHLAEVAARTLAANGQRVRWQPVGELLDRLRASQGRDEENGYAHLAQVAATPWLVLDDLGKSKPSEWVLDRLYALINSRAVRQARTMITTNDTLPRLAAKLGTDIGDAIADRVFDSRNGLVTVVTMSGPSYRTAR